MVIRRLIPAQKKPPRRAARKGTDITTSQNRECLAGSQAVIHDLFDAGRIGLDNLGSRL